MNLETPEKNFLNLIKANLKILTYILITILAITIISFWFINNKEKDKIKISEKYIEAQILIESGKKIEAKEILTDIIEDKNFPYSGLSLFLIIENNLINDKKLVLEYFDEIINNGNLEKEDSNLLKFKKAIYISDIEKEQEILKLLNPIINSGSVWKNQVLNFLGQFYISNNQPQKANQYYSLLSEGN